jgi:UPF0042 nucleotide-binding protein
MPRSRVIFVSGPSGSGKSTAMAALEDLSFYCVDNLPPQLIELFLDLCGKATPPIHKIAVAIDAREGSFLAALPSAIERLRQGGAEVELIYLECANAVLANRYRETRRVHPLAPDGSVDQGITLERDRLSELARLAGFQLDTSGMNVHELREAIVRHVAGQNRPTVLNLISFGFRYGVPEAAELLFDVRFLPNPHFEPALRAKSGNDPAVAEYVMKTPRTQALMERLRGFLAFLLPLYDEEGKSYLTIAIGCTGGQHRSVAIVNALAEELGRVRRDVNVTHRDVERTR